jgi:hypothetical protein
MPRSTEIIVARLNENIDWVNNSKHPVIIYDKSTDPKYDSRPRRLTHIETVPIKRDDFGWCASTWLKHIINEYDILADHTVFLQGNQADHGGINLSNFEVDTSQQGFYWLGNQDLSTNSDGSPHGFRQIKPVFERLFGKKCPDKFCFKHGYQFVASRSTIHIKPKCWYEYVLSFFIYYGWETKEQWRSHPERYWDYIVNGRTI